MERELRAALLPVAGQALHAGSAPLDKLRTERYHHEQGTRDADVRSDRAALAWVQTHRRPWVSRGWVRKYRCYSERASRFISSTYSPKGIVFPYKPLIGIDLMSLPGCQISKCFSAAFTQQVTRLSSEGSAHVVVLAVDGEIALGPYGPRKGSLLDLHEPAGSHDGLGNSRQGRKC